MTLPFELFPDVTLSLLLYQPIHNHDELVQQMRNGKLECALIDATLVRSSHPTPTPCAYTHSLPLLFLPLLFCVLATSTLQTKACRSATHSKCTPPRSMPCRHTRTAHSRPTTSTRSW